MKKISLFFLSVLVLFGMNAGNLLFVSANTEPVTLTSEKEVIETSEIVNIKADTVLPENAENITYDWSSDNEAAAIVSGEGNVANVTGISPGKAKIAVTVNYNTKAAADTQENGEETAEKSNTYDYTAELEITVIEANERTDSSDEKKAGNENIVKAKKEVEVENNNEALDPVTAEYIKKNINADYAKADMMRLDQVLVVKNTLVDANGIDDDETIDSFFLREDTGDLFITTIPAHIALYNTDEDSSYYVGFADTMFNDATAEVRDCIFAFNNNNGEVINEGCYFDKKTGLAYISKDLFGNVAGNVQVQFLQAVTQSVKKLSSKVQYSTTDEDNAVKTGDGKVDGFDFETKVETDKGLKKSELMVSVNGLPVEDFNYDSKTGEVTVEQSSTAVQSVNVKVDEESVIQKVADKFFNVVDVQAISMSQMGCAGTVDVPDGINTGWGGQISLYKAYASAWGSPTLPAYGLGTNESGLMNLIYHGGGLDYSKLSSQNQSMYLGVWLQGGVDSTTGIWHSSFWNWSPENISGAASPDAWLRLQCTHLSNPDTGKGVEWKDEMINVRVLDKTSDEIVIGFLTKRVNSQSGASIAKFKIKQKQGNLSIKKVNGDPALTAGNDCYSLADAEYQLRDGNGNAVATLKTDANGDAYAGSINAGTYTLVETKASKGFQLNTQQTSVTITAGQTTTLNGTGCLVEQPANDPVGIQIQKNDIDTNASDSQGNASLEGAEFTVKYYAGLYDKVADLPGEATRAWVIKTKKQADGSYKAFLLNSYKVSGDDFYTVGGIPTLPIGTMTIQESKAPDGYLLSGATLVDSSGSSESVDNGVYLTQIKQDDIGGSAQVIAGNFPVVSDKVKKHKVEIEKLSKDSNGVNAPLNDAVFTIKLKSEVEEIGWDDAAVYDEVTTSIIDGKEGYAVTKELAYGTYILRETGTPAGYSRADDIEFSIEKDKSEQDENQLITVTDSETHITLYKYDAETEKPLSNAEYLIYDVTSDKEVGRYKTDDNGIIDIYKLAGGNTYYAQEITAPNGYEVVDSKFYFEFDKDGYVHISDMNGPDISESLFKITGKGEMTISLSNELKWFKLSLSKINDIDRKLAGAEFTLYKDEDCTQEVAKGTTDDNGNLLFDKINTGTYYLRETKSPAGYRKILGSFKIVFKCVNKEHIFSVNDVPVNENSENYSITMENGWYIGNMTVVNKRGAKLPDTGSSATIILICAGIGMCLIGVIQKKKSREE